MEPIPSDTSALNAQNTPKIARPRGRPRKELFTENPSIAGLTYEQQLLCASHIAAHTPFLEAQKEIKQKFNVNLTFHQYEYYKRAPAWQPKIQKMREEYESRVTDEPLSSKRNRVRELSKTYTKMRDSGDLRDSVVVLDKIREEVEGKSSRETNITQYNQYNNLSDDELRKVIQENNRFLEIHTKRQDALAQLEDKTIEVIPTEP